MKQRKGKNTKHCYICNVSVPQTISGPYLCRKHSFYMGSVWIMEQYRNYYFWVPKWNNEEEIERFKQTIDKRIEGNNNDD